MFPSFFLLFSIDFYHSLNISSSDVFCTMYEIILFDYNLVMKNLSVFVCIAGLLTLTWCTLKWNIDNNPWDNLNYKRCTIEEINAQACNLHLNPVCGDNWVTYDNECFACASNEIVWYVSWPCASSCDTDEEEWMCNANISNTDNSPTQEVWLELIVVDENE